MTQNREHDRKHVSLKTKLASALLTIVAPDDEGRLVPVIPYDAAKTMTADQIISHFHFDHVVLHTLTQDDRPANLVPRPVKIHREKTAKIDIPQNAKTKRLEKQNDEFRRSVLAKSGQGEVPDTSVKAGGCKLSGQKLRGRKFASGQKLIGANKIKSRGFEKSKRVRVERFRAER